ncbi:TIGR01906 family membrane protein [Apilactobacillus apinorum]|uniref:TIGR01906 family membrane protein n=1 Tax=Apilactobacillus apinorum TaxID=1218495 RepID=UPI00333EB02E
MILAWLVCLSVFLFMNLSIIYLTTIKILNIPASIHISMASVSNNYTNIIRYLQSPFINQMHTVIPVNEVVIRHFRDVKTLLMISNTLMIILTLIAVKLIKRLSFSNKLWLLKMPLRSTYMLFTFLILFSVVDFNDAFVFMHKLLFRNQDWIFDEKKEPIINLFPSQYFMVGFIFIFLLVSIGMVLILNKIKKDS